MGAELSPARILERDNYQCQVCGTTHDLEIHHVVFRSQSGSDEPDNRATICHRCHMAVHDRELWIELIAVAEGVHHVFVRSTPRRLGRDPARG